MFRRHLLLARTGWLVQQPLISLTNTTPSAPSTVASQHSIDGAASPPRLRRGMEGIMRRLIGWGILTLILSTPAFGQSTYATVSGTVADSSGAVLPGVSLTATNNATGVVTTVISNEAGAYNFASLLPGAYKVSAELPGFQIKSYTNVQLGNADKVRLNFALQVATQAQSVEVTV